MAQEKEPLGLVWQLQEPVRHISRGLKGLKGLKRLEGASGSFGPVEAERLGLPQPLVWQQQFGTRKGTTWLSLAAPRAGSAHFEGFEGFEAFGGSIRQFRASRKRKTWLATAASFSPEKELLGLPQPLVWQLQEPVWHVWKGLRGFEAFGGSIRQFRASRKRKTWLATAASFSQPLVWQQQFGTRKGTTWLSLAAARAGLAHLARFEGFEAFGGSIRQFRASRKRKTWLATAASFLPEKEPLGMPQPLVWQLQEPLWHVSRV